jgi:hypothetical protein
MDKNLLKLEKVISQEYIDELRDIIIYQDIDGSFNLYGKYTVIKTVDGVYKVNVDTTYTEQIFYKLTNAIAWCSFDKRKLYNKASRLQQLDRLVYSMDTEIQIQAKLLKKTKDPSNAIIYLSKLSNNKAKKRNFISELNYFITEYKNYQNGLFDKSKLLSHQR